MPDATSPLLDIFKYHVNLVSRVCIQGCGRPLNVEIYLMMYICRECFVLVYFLRVVIIVFIIELGLSGDGIIGAGFEYACKNVNFLQAVGSDWWLWSLSHLRK